MASDDDEGSPAGHRILDVVITMLESGGPDAVNLQEVARRARVSLTTVYKHFESRDELIAAAVADWMHTPQLGDREPARHAVQRVAPEAGRSPVRERDRRHTTGRV